MEVFLGWSGNISRAIAEALRDWIPLVIQSARPFVSTEDIEKGKRWSDVLSEELSKSDYGIVCITSENYNSPWLHFEAGAISKAVGNPNVSPLLFKIASSEIAGPLTQFQHTNCVQNEILELMQSINKRVDTEVRMTDAVLTKTFNKWWGDLQEKFQHIEKMEIKPNTGFKWLYNTPNLTKRVHRTKEHECIWWITPHAFRHVLANPPERSAATEVSDNEHGSLRECIRSGIKRGVEYTFIIPASEPSGDFEAISKFGGMTSDRVQIVQIPKEELSRAAPSDYVIVNPEADSMEIFVELPVDPPGYWIKIYDPETAGGIAARFRVLARMSDKDLVGSPKTAKGSGAVGNHLTGR